ncbi:MAG: hypothetical protein A3F17_08400 [Gammaproteobacteria bacterium RIFCSPHIGHO2_12_FULL_41_15]|nr:MAG: hypothetical protein A3F17_08400 [Gammaproteobacteria bacterium RIFCSPHIGHO2_12_FULL_41_15]
MWIIIAYFLLGCIAGTTAGLLGLGGGIVIIPGLLWLYAYQGFPPSMLMHMAAGTSLAIIAFSSIAAMIARRKQLNTIMPSYIKIAPGLILGAWIGALLASKLETRVLMILFAMLVYFMAIRMWFDRFYFEQKDRKPGRIVFLAFGMLAGLKSGLLGIGGGILTVPFFTYLGKPVREAMTLSVLVSLTVALFGASSFVYHGWHLSGLPDHSWGYVYWPALLGTAMGSLLFASFGVWLNGLLPSAVLRKLFAAVLVIVGTKMLYLTLT